nr:AAA family ATPase [Xanthomonas nasturtii]
MDSAEPQSAVLIFTGVDGTPLTVSFGNQGWDNHAADILVFDAEFVARNVYAGAEVTAEHRAKLLDFAIGEGSVGAKIRQEKAQRELTQKTAEQRQQTSVILLQHQGLSFSTYVALAEVADPAAQLASLNAKLDAATNIEAIRKKPAAVEPVLPAFSIDALFDILAESLPSLSDTANARVKKHISDHDDMDFANWLSHGLTHTRNDTCPYCETSLNGNALTSAYAAYFNEAYQTLRDKSAKLESQVNHKLRDTLSAEYYQQVDTAIAVLNGWNEQVKARPIQYDVMSVQNKVDDLKSFILPLVRFKAQRPLESIGTAEQRAEAKRQWSFINLQLSVSAQMVKAANSDIKNYKDQLSAASADGFKLQIAKIKGAVNRHSASGIAALAIYDNLTAEIKALTKVRDEAKNELATSLTTTLETYKNSINTLLNLFGTKLSIEQLGMSFRGAGAAPRSNYVLKLRESPILLSGDEGTAFGTALSEGDKRALAFAFFIAKVQNDPGLPSKIVVIDDPMCSLDRMRRSHTIQILKKLAVECRQLIILAHDASFLQSLDDSLERIPQFKKPKTRTYVKITTAQGDYSTFGLLDLAKECASFYQDNLKAIVGFRDAKEDSDKQLAALALRVAVESSIHRQFPNDVKRGKMLGECINEIDKSSANSPLAALKAYVPKLHALNEYAKHFHHAEGEPAIDLASIDEGELRTNCRLALEFIYR